MPPIVPIVEDAASFEVVMLIAPVEALIVACRLLAASAALSPFSVETWPVPVPKVMGSRCRRRSRRSSASRR